MRSIAIESSVYPNNSLILKQVYSRGLEIVWIVLFSRATNTDLLRCSSRARFEGHRAFSRALQRFFVLLRAVAVGRLLCTGQSYLMVCRWLLVVILFCKLHGTLRALRKIIATPSTVLFPSILQGSLPRNRSSSHFYQNCSGWRGIRDRP